jgi:DNA-binding beta-propeller fold protein YncE
MFYSPSDVAVDAAGNVFVADYNNHRIRKITPDGTVTTLAGNGTPAFADGKASVASFHHPTGVAVDAAGNVFVADFRNHRIRKISKKGNVKTVAGTGAAGFADGPGIAAVFNGPWKIAVDKASGVLYVADMNNNRVRRIAPSGVVSTLAGNGVAASVDGFGTSACLNAPVDVDVDLFGSIFVAEYGGHRIRRISSQGNVTTVAGQGSQGLVDGPNAAFSFPYGVVADNHCSIFIADYGNHRIR